MATTVSGSALRPAIDREDFGVSFGAVMEAGGLVVAKKVDIEIELRPFSRRRTGLDHAVPPRRPPCGAAGVARSTCHSDPVHRVPRPPLGTGCPARAVRMGSVGRMDVWTTT